MKFKIPVDIHEALVEYHYRRDTGGQVVPDAAIGSLAAAVRKTRENVHALVSMADALSQDRTSTAEANALKLRESALRLAEATAQKLDDAKVAAELEIEQIEQRTAQPPAPADQATVALEAEIRTRLTGMSDAVRDKVLGDAFSAGDMAVIGAVLRGPAFLAGMHQTRQEMIRHRYRTAYHGDDYARRDRLRNAVQAADRTGQSFINIITEMTNGGTVALAEANANNARSAEAVVAAALAE